MIALTRPVPSSICRCELTHLDRTPIDLGRAREEHAAYEDALGDAGCEVRRLTAADDLPDSVFVEDTAVVLDEVAILARPGAVSRRAEVDSVAAVLAAHRPVVRIAEPATLDGGDVLVLDRHIVVGLTTRTSAAGVDALRRIVEPLGYTVDAVPVNGCLHLKSAVTRAGADTVVLNPAWVDHRRFAAWRVVDVDPAEPGAGNVLWLGAVTIVPAEYPRTADRLARSGSPDLRPVPAAELARAEGGVTCGSLLVR